MKADKSIEVCSKALLHRTLLPETDTAGPIPKLSTLATRGGIYLTARYGLSILVGLGNMFLLTRWIGPHAYGLFVTAVGLTTFLASLVRFGIDTYLVRCEPAPNQRQYDVAFTVILINSLVLVAFGAACAPLVGRWYAADEFIAPYLVLLLTVPLTGVAGLPMAKLERALNFQQVASIELGGQVFALISAAILARRGAGVWAPVAGLFCWQVFALVAACVVARFTPVLRLGLGDARQMLTFGLGFSASMRMWQLRSLVNPLLVGRYAGAEGVALVALALRVAEGIGFLRTAAGRLAIAALARLQSDRTSLTRALEKAQQLQVVILGPLLCFFALCGPWLIPRVLGTRWTAVSTVYPFVAMGVLLGSVFNLQASALFVLGEQWAVLRGYSLHVAVLAVTTYALLPRLGIIAYGWAEVAACGAYVFIAIAVARVAPISYRRVLPHLGVFLAILGMVAGRMTLGTILTVIAGATAILYGRLRWISKDKRSHIVPRPVNSSAHKRAHVFLAKARLRGWSYVAGVTRFLWTSRFYQARLVMPHIRDLLGWSDSKPPHTGTSEQLSNVIPIEGATAHSRFHFHPKEIPSIVSRVPLSLKERTVEEANRVLARQFRFRNHEHVFLESVDWNFSPGGNLSWQWDLNRHRFFLSLATAHYYTGEPGYVSHMLALWRHWIRTNPVAQGSNWKYPFEVAARLQNWLWAYFLALYSGPNNSVDFRSIRHSLLEHAQYVADHLEYHWPNNHLLLEAKALYEFALLFPELDASSKYRNRGLRVLQSEVMRQVLPDGSHAELCSMYHRIVAGELQELLVLSERLNTPLPEALVSRINRMNLFSQAMVRPDGSLPLLGDSASEDTYLRFDFTRPNYSDLNYWLWPEIGECRSSNKAGLQLFPDAGYAFLKNRESDTHLAFDFGPFSRCISQNHGHSDALSFDLWSKGQPVVIDPGIYLPWSDGQAWSHYFRSTGAHNTLEIDARSQSELSAMCDVRRTAQSRLLRQTLGQDGMAVTAECVPYWGHEKKIRHIREITLQVSHLKVRDYVDGLGTYPMSWSFQFAPEIDLVHTHDTLAGRAAGQTLFRLLTHAQRPLQLELFYGHKRPLRGWIARDSTQVVAAPLARFSICAPLPFRVEYTFEL